MVLDKLFDNIFLPLHLYHRSPLSSFVASQYLTLPRYHSFARSFTLDYSMIAARRVPSSASQHYVRTIQTVASSKSSQYGRTAAYRRIGQLSTLPSSVLHTSSYHAPSPATLFRPGLNRSLHISRALQQQAQPKPDPSPSEEVKDPPRQQDSDKSEAKSDEAKSDEAKSDEDKSEKSGEKKDKKDAPPPPPHGDKTPWQVFRDTFSSELKASKEWNESTKQLAGEVQDLRESEGIKKASAAYEKTFGAAGRGAQGAAKVVGKGAALAWETPVVQGIRKGVNATGRGIEQATRPVRETEAFKSVQEAIDDGSSSRYGGWFEKEERRRRRAERDAKDPTRKMENLEEDPK